MGAMREIEPAAYRRWLGPVCGTFAALVLSPLIAFGLHKPNLYPLVLLPTVLVSWGLTGYRPKDLGLTIGRGRFYLAAVAYPCTVIVGLTVVALTTHHVRQTQFHLTQNATEVGRLFAFSLTAAILTEEGFFRGWLWAACTRNGFCPSRTLWFTSVAFSVWHLAITSMPEFHIASWDVPMYLLAILLIGVNLGLLRQLSDSLVVSSVAHASWNSLAYVLFGSGENSGILRISSTRIYDPERGLLGILLNAVIAVALWRIQNTAQRALGRGQ